MVFKSMVCEMFTNHKIPIFIEEEQEFTCCSKYNIMNFLVALNTICMDFLVALTTHSMDLFLALKCAF